MICAVMYQFWCCFYVCYSKLKCRTLWKIQFSKSFWVFWILTCDVSMCFSIIIVAKVFSVFKVWTNVGSSSHPMCDIFFLPSLQVWPHGFQIHLYNLFCQDFYERETDPAKTGTILTSSSLVEIKWFFILFQMCIILKKQDNISRSFCGCHRHSWDYRVLRMRKKKQITS